MTTRLFDHPQTVSEEELNNDLTLLPEWRRKEALSFRFHIDRVLCCKAYLLLADELRLNYGFQVNPDFDFLAHGKPVLRGYDDIHFNLSHCHKGVLCTVSRQPVGCDIEEIVKDVSTDVCHHCMSEQETAGILNAENPCEEFTRLWTMKEAYLKLTGHGLVDNLPALLTPQVMREIELTTTVCRDKGFIFSLCEWRDSDKKCKFAH